MTNLVVKPNRMARTFDRMFSDLFDSTPFLANVNSEWAPRVNITENDDRIKLTFDMPGMERDDIRVTVKDGMLTVSGQRRELTEDKNENFVRNEIFTGEFSRSFTLPETIDTEHVNADYKNGILTLSLPKTEKAKPKQIDVKIS